MPSIEIDLPANVERRRRADGSSRYYFRVKRNCPPNWSKPIRFEALTRDGLTIAEVEQPAAFAAALEQWAKDLNAKLAVARGGDAEKPGVHSLPWVWERYKEDDRYLTKKEPTKKNYKLLARYVREWARENGYPHAARYTYAGVKAFSDGWESAPYQRRAVQRFLSLLFEHAVRLKLRDDNPAAKMDIATPDSEIVIWEDAATGFMVAIADAIGKPSMGTAILICHDIGPREEDVIAMRAPDDYEAGHFRFKTSKTKTKLSIPATAALRARLEAAGVPLHRRLIVTEAKKKPYKADHFRHVFAKVRAAAGAVMCAQALAELIGTEPSRFIDVSSLVYRQLRHTAIVMLARAGCTVPEIAAITGHSIQTVTQILEHYLPRDSVVAENAIAKLETYRART